MKAPIFTNEIIYRLKLPFSYVFMLLLFLQGMYYGKNATFNNILNDGLWLNASCIYYINLAAIGFLLFIVTAIVTGNVLYRDIEQKTAGFLYSYPLNQKHFFLKKFAAAFSVNVLFSLAYVAGLIIMPILYKDGLVGPFPWLQIAYGYAIFMLPNLLLITSLSIALLILFRNMNASYIGVFLLMIFFLLAESVRESTAHLNLVLLLDPLGYGIAREQVNIMSLAQKNTAFFSMSGIFIANRLLWLSVSFILGFVAYHKFSFKYFLNNKKAGKKKKVNVNTKEESLSSAPGEMPLVHQTFKASGYVLQMLRMSVYEFKNVTRPASFKIIMAVLGSLFLCYHFLWVDKYYIAIPQLPLTSLMTSARKPLAFYLYVLLSVFTIELLFKDRTLKVWQIKDAFYLPGWVSVLSKIVAMCGVAFICTLMMFVVGLLIQIGNGFTNIDWGLYVNDLGGVRQGWLSFVMFIVLASFIASVVQNRFIAHALTIAIIVFQLIAVSSKSIEEFRFLYAFIPGVDDYSEMLGYGVLAKTHLWFGTLWGLASMALLLLTVALWNRGLPKNIKVRFLNIKKQLGHTGIGVLWLAIIGIFLMEYGTLEQINKQGNFKSKSRKRDLDANYEKAFTHLDGYPQPSIMNAHITVDLKNEDRELYTMSELLLKNNTVKSIDSLYLEYKEFTRSFAVQYNKTTLTPTKRDSANRVLTYCLPSTLLPGDSLLITTTGKVQYKGFVQSADQQNDLTKRYSFLNSDILPVIGYNPQRKLLENRERKARGLPKLHNRLSPQDNEKYSSSIHGSPMSEGYTGSLKINCAPEQTAVFPGNIPHAVTNTEHQKAYTFTFDEKILHDWHLAVGEYQTKSCQRKGVDGVFNFYPEHSYNIAVFEDAFRESLLFLEKQLGQYPYAHCQILEVPFFHGTTNTYGNVTAISEKLFTAQTADIKSQASIYYILVSSMAEQIIMHELKIADVQGAGVFTHSIPEYYALQFILKKFGGKVYQDFITEKYENFTKGAAKDPVIEPALVITDNCEYVEKDKGAIALCAIANVTSRDVFNNKLRAFLSQYRHQWVNASLLKTFLDNKESTYSTLIDYWFTQKGISDAYYKMSKQETVGRNSLTASSD